MKKIGIIAGLMCALTLTSCNMNVGLGNFHFTKVHLVHSNKCIEIASWYEVSTGIEVKMKDGNALFCSEGTYILIEDYCPICGR